MEDVQLCHDESLTDLISCLCHVPIGKYGGTSLDEALKTQLAFNVIYSIVTYCNQSLTSIHVN